ncbi:MAG: AAA family ATPase, partial [Candidatus Micrarchaeota archaeon]
MEAVENKPPSNDLVEGVIPSEPCYIILGGRTGIGKSIFTLQLLLSICAGKKWLTFATRKRPCGYLGFEGEEKKVYDRLAKLHNAFPNGAFSDLEFNLWSPTKLIPNEAAFKIAYGNKGLALVALDPLKFLVSGEYTKPSDAVNFIYAIERLARDLRCPI